MSFALRVPGCFCGLVYEADFCPAIDGGGIRGYASLLILEELMRQILAVEHELDDKLDRLGNGKGNGNGDGNGNGNGNGNGAVGNNRRRPRDMQLPLPCHYFNYIIGTSTGG